MSNVVFDFMGGAMPNGQADVPRIGSSMDYAMIITNSNRTVTGFLFLLVIAGCSPVAVSSLGEDETSSRFDTSRVVSNSQLMQNSDLLRLTQLWEHRSRESITDDYPIGPGDVIEINVAGMEEMTHLSERVTAEGTVALPFVGAINVRGLTDKALRTEIKQRLEQGFMRNPQVSVFVKEFRSRQVAVIGAVQKPGLYNLASSADTVLSVIAQAGGVKPEAAERILFIPGEPVDSKTAKEVVEALPVSVMRQDPSPLVLKNMDPLVINLDSISRKGQERFLSIPARPGDIIMVPGGGEVLVQGWVAKPGAYKITSGLTLLGAIAAAGGAMFPANTETVELIRTDYQGRKTLFSANLDVIKTGKQPDIAVREGDVIDVSSSGPKLAAYGVYRLFTTIIHVGANVPLVR
jgi:polysaccharide export outer membrane protein